MGVAFSGHNILALPNVDAPIGSIVGLAAFDQHVFAGDGVQAGAAVVLVGPVAPGGFKVAEGNAKALKLISSWKILCP